MSVYQVTNFRNFEMFRVAVQSVVKSFKLIKPFRISVIHRNCNYLIINKKCNRNDISDIFVNFFRSNERYSQLTYSYKGNNPAGTIMTENVTLLQETDIKNISYSDLLYFLHFHHMGDNDQSLHDNVDEHCSKELYRISRELVYKSLDVWYSLFQGNIMTKKVYLQFLSITSVWLQSDTTKMEEIVYIMFYASLLKNSQLSQNIIKKCLIQIEKSVCYLNPEELCIVVNSSFKASVKIKSKKFLKHISQFAIENLKLLVQDPVYLVALVKGLRLAKYHDFTLLNVISSAEYSGHILNMNLIAKIHVLALYADAVYNKKKFVPSLIQSCLNDFSNENAGLTEILTIRLKDISRLLWALGYLGHNISPNELIKITDKLQSVMHEGKKKNADQIVSCLLSLWMLGDKSPTFFNTAVINNLMQRLRERNVFRSLARLCLLLTTIQIEMPVLLSDDLMKWEINNIIPPRAVENQLKKRELLLHVYTAIKNLSKNMSIHVIYGCFVPNLNIVGITVQSSNGKIMHFEVLDSTTCLYNTFKPHGIMKLKLRLLECLGHQVLIIPEDKYDAVYNSNQLYEFLEEQLAALEQVSHEHPGSTNK